MCVFPTTNLTLHNYCCDLHSTSSSVHDPGVRMIQYSEPSMLGAQHSCPESDLQMSTNWLEVTRAGSRDNNRGSILTAGLILNFNVRCSLSVKGTLCLCIPMLICFVVLFVKETKETDIRKQG